MLGAVGRTGSRVTQRSSSEATCAARQTNNVKIFTYLQRANIVAESLKVGAATAGTYRFASITCCAAAQGD